METPFNDQVRETPNISIIQIFRSKSHNIRLLFIQALRSTLLSHPNAINASMKVRLHKNKTKHKSKVFSLEKTLVLTLLWIGVGF